MTTIAHRRDARLQALDMIIAAKPCQPASWQTGDDLDILPHALDIHPTAPALSLQAGADKGAIRLGEPACGIFMVRVAAEDDGEMGHGLFDLPHQTGVDLLIWMRHLDRVCAHTRRHSSDFSR